MPKPAFHLLGMYPDYIEAIGTVRRAYMRFIVELDDGSKLWLYFGSTPELYPPPQFENAPIEQYSYVQFPEDLDNLGPEYMYELFLLARIVAFKREGWE